MLREHFKTRVYFLVSVFAFCASAHAQQYSDIYSSDHTDSAPVVGLTASKGDGKEIAIVSTSDNPPSIVNIVQAPVRRLFSRGSPAAVTPAAAAPQSCAALPTVAQPIFVSVPTKPDDFWRPGTVFPLVLSLLSFFLAGGNIWYTVTKDRRARRHSVVDDYWFRKVLSPMTLEPMLTSIQELMTSIPEDRSSGSFQLRKVNKFHESWVKKLSNMAAEMNSLDMLEAGLGRTVAEDIDAIQDLVIEYGSAQQPKGAGQTKDEFRNAVQLRWLTIMRIIKEAQSKLK